MNLQRGSVDFWLVTISLHPFFFFFWPYCRQISLLQQKISGAFSLYNRGLTSVRHRGAVYAVCDSSESLEKAMWKTLCLCASGKDGGRQEQLACAHETSTTGSQSCLYTFDMAFCQHSKLPPEYHHHSDVQYGVFRDICRVWYWRLITYM